MAITDLEAHYVDANPAFCALLGRECSAVVGRRAQDFLVEYRGESVATQVARMLAGDYDAVTAEASIRRGDGSLAWVQASIALIRDGSGRPDFFFVQHQDITDRLAAVQALERAQSQLRRTLDSVVDTVAAALDVRDPYTAGHQRRVATIADAISVDLGLDTEIREGIALAATIHDIGKIATPAEILTKPTRLSPQEFEIIKLHPQVGHDIVSAVEFPWPIARMILEHHERSDGSGYPFGLRESETLLGSRVIAVADVLEAMSAHRPYRAGLGLKVALEAIGAGRGTLFDPQVVDACQRCADLWNDLPVQ